MSIFSKVKNAKKAASQHQHQKKDSSSSTTSTSTSGSSASSSTDSQDQQQPSAPKPYVHVPTHAARDAMVGAPSPYTPAEARARIAAETTKKALVRPASHQCLVSKADVGRRNVGEVKLPPRASITRTQSDLSIESVLRNQSPGQGNRNGQGRYERRSDPSLASSSEDGKKTSPYTYSPANDPAKTRERTYVSHQRTKTASFVKSPLSETVSGQEHDSVMGSSANSTHTVSSSSSKSHHGLEMKPHRRHSSTNTAAVPNNSSSYFPSFAPSTFAREPYAVQPPSSFTAAPIEQHTLPTVSEMRTPPQTPGTPGDLGGADGKARKKSWFGGRRRSSFAGTAAAVSAH
ncbi:hypothetical protein K490DRAFT_59896 [Saccharata proteae CBS 121410]|uniref:Uncharacterized protein n=1 Tax=Saccharata proteae CBS 121410 TaxID=1314787 RepID=A0A9P4HQF9_9PEZI|nr:hypothetical protein K490DRAFT_59896 [Saccharata proteae CBS 121410]